MAEPSPSRLSLTPAPTPRPPAAVAPSALEGLPLDAGALEEHFGFVLPDYVHADYPYDVPPSRLDVAMGTLSWIGAWRSCPHAPCRRARFCSGTEGPPCYRADRRALQQALLVSYLQDLGACGPSDYDSLLTEAGNRYAVIPPESRPDPRPRRMRRRRR